MTSFRFQFRLSTLLWITLAEDCFFGGARAERWRAEIKGQGTSFNPNVERPW
jgi:hypothetical protein